MITKQRFEKKIYKEKDCWIWRGSKRLSKSKQYYGIAYISKEDMNIFKRKVISAHRLSFLIFKEDIPKSKQIHHTCKNTLCVNPDHLKAVTQKEHNILHNNFTVINEKKTHCPKGHEYTNDNTHTNKKGWRICLTCRTERDSKRPERGDNRKKEQKHVV